MPGVQLVYLPRVGVDAEHVEPEAGHARGVGDAEVTGAQYGQAQWAGHDPGLVNVLAPWRNAAAAAGLLMLKSRPW